MTTHDTDQDARIDAINDLSISATYLMAAVRMVANGADLKNPEVAHHIRWAIRKVAPIADASRV